MKMLALHALLNEETERLSTARQELHALQEARRHGLLATFFDVCGMNCFVSLDLTMLRTKLAECVAAVEVRERVCAGLCCFKTCVDERSAVCERAASCSARIYRK